MYHKLTNTTTLMANLKTVVQTTLKKRKAIAAPSAPSKIRMKLHKGHSEKTVINKPKKFYTKPVTAPPVQHKPATQEQATDQTTI